MSTNSETLVQGDVKHLLQALWRLDLTATSRAVRPAIAINSQLVTACLRRDKESVKYANANARVRASAVEEAGTAGVQLTIRKDCLIHNARRWPGS